MKKSELRQKVAEEITDPRVAQVLWALGRDCWYPLASAAMAGRRRDARYNLLMDAPYDMLSIMDGLGLIDLSADDALTAYGADVARAAARLIWLVGLSLRDARVARSALLKIGAVDVPGVAP